MRYYLEAKKIIDFRVIIIVILIFLINAVNVNKSINTFIYSDDKRYIEKRTELYHKLEGDMESSKLNYIEKKKNELEKIVDSGNYNKKFDDSTLTGYVKSDYNLYNEIFEHIEYNKKYYEYSDDLKSRSRKNYEYYSEKNNQNEVRKYKYLTKKYGDRDIKNIVDVKSISAWLDYDESDFFIFIILIILISPIFSNDREKKTACFTLTTRYGKNKLCYMKLKLVMIITLSIPLVVYLSNYLIYFFRTECKKLDIPLYYICEYKDSTYTGTIWQFAIWTSILKVLAFLVFAMIFAVASSIVNKNIYSISLGILFTIIIYLFSSKVKLLSFMKLFDIKDQMKKYWSADLCGMQVHGVYEGLVSAGIIIVLSVVLVIFFECKIKGVIKKERI